VYLKDVTLSFLILSTDVRHASTHTLPTNHSVSFDDFKPTQPFWKN